MVQQRQGRTHPEADCRSAVTHSSSGIALLAILLQSCNRLGLQKPLCGIRNSARRAGVR